MEKAIGTTFKVGKDELMVKEIERLECVDEHGVKCYFYKKCLKGLPVKGEAGNCVYMFRKDRKNVIFIKK